jgi:hypothetical protein
VDDDTAHREEIFNALALRTAHEWNADPANAWRIHSWSDFNRHGEPVVGPNDRITRAEFDRRKYWCSGVGRLSPDELAQLRSRGEGRS